MPTTKDAAGSWPARRSAASAFHLLSLMAHSSQRVTERSQACQLFVAGLTSATIEDAYKAAGIALSSRLRLVTT